MKWVFAVLLSLPCLTPAFCNDWELVFPEHYRLGQDHTLLSIGAKVCADRPNEYLIGCESGWVIGAILGDPEESTSWTPIKLPFDYDISAVDVVDDQWIIGIVGDSGISTGQVAIHAGADPAQPDLSDLSTGWDVHQLDPNLEVSELACIGDTVLALLQGKYSLNALHRSTDGGLNWEVVPDITDVRDIEAFNGRFFVICLGESGAELVASEDGLQYDTVWTITDTYGSNLNANLNVVDMATDAEGLPTGGDPRLYINGSLAYSTTSDGYYHSGVNKSFLLSTKNGVTWFDHGSNTYEWWTGASGGRVPSPWNPLSLPDTNKNADWPFWFMGFGDIGKSAGNFALETVSLKQFNGNTWRLVNSRPDGYARLQTNCIAQGNKLTFVFFDQPNQPVQARFITIARGNVVSEHSPPNLKVDIRWIEQLIAIGDTTHVKVLPEQNDSILLTSTNFQEWSILPFPISGKSWYLKSDGSHLIGLCPQSSFVTTYQLHENWIPGFEYTAKDPAALAFVEQTDSWYSAHQYSEDLHVSQLGETGDWEDLCTMTPKAVWRPYYMQLACPDGQRLVVFGKSAEIFIVETDGYWRSAYPWQSIAPDLDRIDSVSYANGWYYFLSDVTVRTRDFIEFESVPLPDDEPLIHVTMFDRQIYGFTPNAVFAMPCETGYLDSMEPKPGWHQADWIGWFQIIDKELGDIDHLLLGKCWVKQTSELEYWIRTEALGWIYMRKDWSPWFWRLEDAHWYLLDHDSWPPRAWDGEDQEWEKLGP